MFGPYNGEAAIPLNPLTALICRTGNIFTRKYMPMGTVVKDLS
jgi:hypothetical protein